ncbi:membrane associated aspartyl protease with a transmembrane domain at the C-terminus [Cryptosporidium bovis]|uniref:membrane associated aspartyl protease with a transmembrane domain at the C-terminus n=1 Tax=Cryptosporidium bovis TaxID=310047 RepID=UPI003519EF31|nr:membrane associated aspartyl protease with a transmembrane domain at the C-terminus [Cryptosporidium bovis]
MNSNKILLFLILATHISFHVNLEIPVYGSISELGYYYIKVFAGYPTIQVQTLLIDTGSSFTGFACSDCLECGFHEYKPYNASLSNSKILKCNTNTGKNVLNSNIIRRCNCSQEGTCIYSVKYSEGSRLTGYFIEDFVEFENMPPISRWNKGKERNNSRLVIGCNLFEHKPFKHQKATGIMGLGNFKTVDYLNSVINNVFNNRSVLKSELEEIISIHLNKRGGKLVFGYVINNKLSSEMSELKPIQRCSDEERYCGYVRNIKINGYKLTTGRSSENHLYRAIFDTGTTITVLPSNIYNNLINQILKVVIKLYPYISGYDYMDGTTCWKISNTVSINEFPNLELEFVRNQSENTLEYSTINWTSNSYLFINEIIDSENKIYCLGIVSDNVNDYLSAAYDVNYNAQNYQDEIILGATFFVDREISLFLNKGQILIGSTDIDTSNINEKYLLVNDSSFKDKYGRTKQFNKILSHARKINVIRSELKDNRVFKLIWNKFKRHKSFLTIIIIFNPFFLILIIRSVRRNNLNKLSLGVGSNCSR